MAADLAHTAHMERAWHLVTVLVRLGRPAPAAELSYHCALTPAPSPSLVELLCLIPGSPLLLTEGGFITVSESAVVALAGFVSSVIAPFVPRVVLRSAERRIWRDLSLVYVRKRKVRPLSGDLVVPRAKRRLLLAADKDLKELGEGDGSRQLSQNPPTEVCLTAADIFTKDVFSVGNSSVRQILSTWNQNTLLPSLANSSIVVSSIGSTDHVGTFETDKMCNKAQVIIANKELQEATGYKHSSLDNEEDARTSKPSEGLQNSELGAGPALSDKVLDKHIPGGDPKNKENSQIGISLDPRNEVTLNLPFSLGTSKICHIAYAETGIGIGHLAKIEENVRATHGNDAIGTEELALTVPFTARPTSLWKEQTKPFEKPKNIKMVTSSKESQSLTGALANRKNANPPKHEQSKRNMLLKQKMKRNRNQSMPAKEYAADAIPKGSKAHLEPKPLPDFESFAVEEEEGSGGYGTVYRAQRKEDGKIVAIKCPHANAHIHHINNELRMLERFGGRNFVIKYEGSFRSGDLECSVLEHVEHDRPEVLKKEVDVFELQWYGYCMFRALACLHKQGIVHRDVKPGNFLFSRKLNKGYLIDFNLAHDLHKKFYKSSKSDSSSNLGLDPLSLQSVRSSSFTQARKLVNDGMLGNVGNEAGINPKKPLLSKNTKNRFNKGHVDTFLNIENKSKFGNQAADISGVTSAKDPTSTRTPSVDRLKQPIPLKGRKELINFVQEALQSPNKKAVTVPVSQRKRVAAPSGKVDKKLIILTPMPLHSGGNVVAGSGMLKNPGNGKHKKEGPCVGTKGFRAPEVLFKSYHQGSKVDIWSAGVTLLYMMIGRAPFGGDPEQNIKEIAKMRGSEVLWEVAKLHNCETLFPEDLFDVQYLRPTELKDWCALNTRRPDFLELVPQSLFDLVDKCLTVNPRQRITAEEALMHDFFAPCHESLRKQRQLRRTVVPEPGCLSL